MLYAMSYQVKNLTTKHIVHLKKSGICWLKNKESLLWSRTWETVGNTLLIGKSGFVIVTATLNQTKQFLNYQNVIRQLSDSFIHIKCNLSTKKKRKDLKKVVRAIFLRVASLVIYPRSSKISLQIRRNCMKMQQNKIKTGSKLKCKKFFIL